MASVAAVHALQWRGDPVLLEHYVPVQLAATPGDGHGAKPARAGRPGLACSGLQHDEPPAKDIANRY